MWSRLQTPILLRSALLYGQLKSVQRPAGRPMKPFNDVLQSNLRRCNINRTTWETATQARSSWRQTCFAGVSEFKKICIAALQEKRAHRKENQFINDAATNTADVCHICSRQCAAAIGLVSDIQSHKCRASSANLGRRFHQPDTSRSCKTWTRGQCYARCACLPLGFDTGARWQRHMCMTKQQHRGRESSAGPR